MFECTRCANRRTPLCELCRIVILADGADKLQSMFVDCVEPVERDEETMRAATNIMYYLSVGRALPVEEVLQYNKRLELWRREQKW